MAVTEKLYPEEDHFLFFARRDDVLGVIDDWLEEIPGFALGPAAQP